MAAGEFQETSIDWEIQQFFQRVGEGFEGLFARSLAWPTPEPAPAWISQSLFWIIMVGMGLLVGRWLFLLARPYTQQWLTAVLTPRRSPTSDGTPPAAIADWVAQFRRARQEGRYGDACRALYMAMIHNLDQQNEVAFDPSRTNGEYLSLTRHLDRPTAYQTLIRTHERLYFGQVPISADECDRCWQAYQDLNRP